jgi:hypothetical protein
MIVETTAPSQSRIDSTRVVARPEHHNPFAVIETVEAVGRNEKLTPIRNEELTPL